MRQMKTRYILINAGKALAWLAVFALIYIIFKKYVEIDFLDRLKPLFDNESLILLIFLASEIVVGIIPPEVFIIWALRNDHFGEFISLIWSYGSQVLIALSIFFIILGAFFYVASAGNEDRISQGKQMIFGSLIAIVIVIFSGVLIRTLHQPTEGTAGYLTDIPTVINNATNILIEIKEKLK